MATLTKICMQSVHVCMQLLNVYMKIAYLCMHTKVQVLATLYAYNCLQIVCKNLYIYKCLSIVCKHDGDSQT